MYEIDLSGRKIGGKHPCFIIAEAGVNHNGSLELALKLVDHAAASGADGIKFQLYRPEEQVSSAAPTTEYQYKQTAAAHMLEMSKSYEMAWENHYVISAYCKKKGIRYMASCFDPLAVQFLMNIGGTCIKAGSGEITNYPLLSSMARSGLPIILSTGMSTMLDIAGAVEHIRSSGGRDIILLQCVSNYPAHPSTVNLRSMAALSAAFQTPAGFSDHTLDYTAAIVAIALGACIIEKHFTLDKNLPGPDHAMSLTPADFADFVRTVRLAESTLGDGIKKPHPSEIAVQTAVRRSLVSARLIVKGESLTDENVTLKRPAAGIDPRLWEAVRNRRVNRTIEKDVPITWEMLL